MTKEQIDIALQFLSRVELKGSEAPALMSVMNALQELLQPKASSKSTED